jgi:phage terminase small subunit
MALNDRQQLFVEEYLLDLNATQAAIRAGYAQGSAHVTGAKLLKNAKVKQAIAEAKNGRTERTKINADYVLNRLVEIDQMDVADILEPNCGLKPVAGWPKVWRQYISGMDLAEINEGYGDERELVGLLKKIKWPDKLKNLELLGKHIDVSAFKENHNHVIAFSDLSDEELDKKIQAAQERLTRGKPGEG